MSGASIEQMTLAAANAVSTARGTLEQMVRQIGVVPSWSGQNVHASLMEAIEVFCVAQARREVLHFMHSQDFYHAMMLSAGAEDQNK